MRTNNPKDMQARHNTNRRHIAAQSTQAGISSALSALGNAGLPFILTEPMKALCMLAVSLLAARETRQDNASSILNAVKSKIAYDEVNSLSDALLQAAGLAPDMKEPLEALADVVNHTVDPSLRTQQYRSAIEKLVHLAYGDSNTSPLTEKAFAELGMPRIEINLARSLSPRNPDRRIGVRLGGITENRISSIRCVKYRCDERSAISTDSSCNFLTYLPLRKKGSPTRLVTATIIPDNSALEISVAEEISFSS